MRKLWYVLGGLALLVLTWLMLDPAVLLEKRQKRVAGTAAQQATVTRDSFKKDSDRAAGAESDGKVDRSIETGSGKEVPGEKILRFKDAAAYRRFLASAPRGVVLGQIDALQAVRVKDGDWLKSMSASSEMTLGSNYYVKTPEVPLEIRTMGDSVYRTVGAKALELMGAEGVSQDWGKNVKVALLDTGLSQTDTQKGAEVGHGTSMASLISGASRPAVGAAPGAKILDFSVLDGEGQGNSFALAEAIMKAVAQGAQVINMSLGSAGDSSVVGDAVAYALSRNVALVAAAGNDGVNLVSYPAAYDGVVGVASVDADRQQLYFSNRGKSVDVAAPGFQVIADWPGGKLVEVSGTSASTALVSGAIAALISKEPGLTGKQAAELIQQYADDTGVAGVDDETGHGVVDLQRVLERNQRGIIDLAIAGVTMTINGNAGLITVGVQNRGTEIVNSPTFEIMVGGSSRKFYPGSLALGQSMAEAVQFDVIRARQDGGVSVNASIQAPRGTDQRPGNDMWSGWFKVSK